MRIAVYHNLGSGGSKRVLFEYMKRLAREHEIDLFDLSMSDKKFFNVEKFAKNHYCFEYKKKSFYAKGIGVLLNPLVSLWNLFAMNSLSKMIAKEIDARNYDLVFVKPCLVTQSPLVLLYLKTKSVYFCPELLRRVYEKDFSKKSILSKIGLMYARCGDFFYKLFDKAAARKATIIVTNSNYTKQCIASAYGKNAKVNYPGVNFDKFKPLGLKKENFVMCLGRVSFMKGHDFIVKSLALIDEKIRPRFVIVADSSVKEEEEIFKLAKKLKVSVEIKKMVHDKELVELYNTARLFVYAPLKEPFGMAVPEAMACGTAVVAVAEGGPKETVENGKSGFLVERNEKEFAAAIRKLLKNEKLRKRMENNAIMRAKEFSWDNSFLEFTKNAEITQNAVIEGSMLIHIAFYYTRDRLKYLKQLLENFKSYKMSKIDIVIDTNSEKSKKICERIFKRKGSVSIYGKSHENIEHPFDLTWTHRKDMKAKINDYDFFLYTEDDIFIPWKAILRWHRETQQIYKAGYVRGFLRVEINQNNVVVSTDFRKKLFAPAIKRIDGQKYFVPKEPYHAFWIYNKKQMQEFVQHKAWIDGNHRMGKRERAALGMLWDTPKKCRALLPVEKGLTVPDDAVVYHLGNPYANDESTLHGKIPAKKILEKYPKIFYSIKGLFFGKKEDTF